MKGYPKSHITTAVVLAICFLLAINAVPAKNDPDVAQFPVSLSIQTTPEQAPTIAENQTAAVAVIEKPVSWQAFKVSSGDSLSSIFNKAGLSPRDLHEIISLGPDTSVLGKILPGQTIYVHLNDAGKLETLRYELSPLKKLFVTRRGDTFEAEWDVREPEVLLSYKTAQITDKNPSLYHAGKDAGLSDNLIMKLSNIFQWDISFALDLRQGDSFTVLYEDIYVDGEKIKEGNILAANFNNYGKTYTAVRYEDKNGTSNYYTPEGRSLRKAFLRDPVHFSHVSSSFNLARLHPIHKKVMPHRGIDYAANRGTPVVAAGDGKVSIARQNNASGRYVVIKHGEQYMTKYLHLSAFARGIRAGTNVKQGQTIGYVGASGWATAPHLHYEFLVNGVHRNPRTVKLPKADPIRAADIDQFRQATMPILARLESVNGNRGYASAKSSGSDGE